MAAAAAAMDLRAGHSVTSIDRGLDRTGDRIVEARPSGSALEFRARHEQRLAAARALERAGAFLVVERTASGTLGAVSPQHVVLLGRQQTAPFLVAVGDCKPLLVHAPNSRADRLRSIGVAIEQLDRHLFRPAQEGNAHSRPYCGGFPGELGPLGLELGDHGVDAADGKPEMIEALIGRGWRRIDAVAGSDRCDENIGAAELEVDARLALLHGTD